MKSRNHGLEKSITAIYKIVVIRLHQSRCKIINKTQLILSQSGGSWGAISGEYDHIWRAMERVGRKQHPIKSTEEGKLPKKPIFI